MFSASSGHAHAGGASGKKVLVTNLDVTGLTALYQVRVNAGGTALEAVSPVVPPTVTVNRAFGFYIASAPLVIGTNLSWEPTVPQSMTCVKVWGSVKTAPTGADIKAVLSIKGGSAIAQLTISAGSTSGNTTAFTTFALTAGMILQLEVTQIGAVIPGDSLSVVLECTQP